MHNRVRTNNIAAGTAKRKKLVGIVTSLVHLQEISSPSSLKPHHMFHLLVHVDCDYITISGRGVSPSDATPQENVPIRGGGARGLFMTEFCSRELALLAPESGEL